MGLVLCLWSFDMLRESFGTTITDRSYLMLTDSSARAAYVQNALVPMVSAPSGHPGIVAWEVFNEAEGMSTEYGWCGIRRVSMRNIQTFVNQVAGAIHRTDPSARVTTGAWSFIAMSDVTTLSTAADPGSNPETMSLAEKARIEAIHGTRLNRRNASGMKGRGTDIHGMPGASGVGPGSRSARGRIRHLWLCPQRNIMITCVLMSN